MAIYFIQVGATGPVKIGTAADVAARLRDLQVAHYEQLTVIGACDGGRRDEAALHRRFDASRIRGEWFHPAPDILAFVDGLPPSSEQGRHPAEPSALQRAIKLLGRAHLAEKLGITPQAISLWDQVPIKRAVQIEAATGGAVTREDLRPDLFAPLRRAVA